MDPSQLPHVTLLLSSVGYKGQDIDQLIPDFSTEYDTTVGLKWYPSATGPETWILTIGVGIPLGVFLKKFAELLAVDIYNWAKSSLQAFFSNRPHNHGVLIFEFEGITLISYQPLEVLMCTDLLSALSKIEFDDEMVMEIIYDSDIGEISLKPIRVKE